VAVVALVDLGLPRELGAQPLRWVEVEFGAGNGNANDAAFASAVATHVTNALATTEGIRVTSRADSSRPRFDTATGRPVEQYSLHGRVVRRGNDVQLYAYLSSYVDEFILQWSHSYSSADAKVLADEIVGGALARLRLAFDPREALALVYGGSTWADPGTKRYGGFFANADSVFVRPAFVAAFEEAGVAKRFVIAALEPSTDYTCNACVPLLGGAVFRHDGERWVVDAANKLIGAGGGYGTRYRLASVGRNHYAVVYQVSYKSDTVYQHASVIFAIDGVLAARFTTAERDTPGPGGCDVPEPRLELSFTNGSDESPRYNEEYRDLVVDEQWNDGHCRGVKVDGGMWYSFAGRVCRNVSRYRVSAGQYVPLETQLNGCSDWRASEQ